MKGGDKEEEEDEEIVTGFNKVNLDNYLEENHIEENHIEEDQFYGKRQSERLIIASKLKNCVKS